MCANSLSFFIFRRSTLISEPWPIDGVLDALATIGSGAPDTRWGSLLARANSTAFIVTARVASVALVVSAGFIAHLCLLGAHVSWLTTKEEMDVVEPNPMISDERMDVDSSSNNNKQLLLLPQEENTARGLPFPHTVDSNGQHTIQYIGMYVLFYLLPPLYPKPDPFEQRNVEQRAAGQPLPDLWPQAQWEQAHSRQAPLRVQQQ